MSDKELRKHFEQTYAYQAQVKDSPLIKAWLDKVATAVAAMQGAEVEFVTSLQGQDADDEVYHAHKNQRVTAFLQPVLTSTEKEDVMDEECLPYYRVRFADGVELLADDAELFSLDPRFAELVSVVSGAFGCARELDFAGPRYLAAHGTAADKARFTAAFNAHKVTLPFEHWTHNHNTPEKYRLAATETSQPSMS